MVRALSRCERGIPAVLYLRMSSDKQEASIPAQRNALEAFAKERGYRTLREYSDEAISGDATEKRFGFQRMIADAAKGDFRVVLCWDQDRFGRFDPLEAGYWIKPLRDAGVRLVTIAQGEIDWDDFAGRLIYSVAQEAKNSYLSDLSRNVLRGLAEAAQKGRWLSGRPPFGYAVDPDTQKLVLGDEHQQETLRWMFQTYLSGHSLRSIADQLNGKSVLPSRHEVQHSRNWSGNTIRAILTNPVYVGMYRWNAIGRGKYNRLVNGRPEKAKRGAGVRRNDESQQFVIENNHPALIDRATFDAVQRRLGENRKRTTPTKDAMYLLTGRVVCAHCGHRMYGKPDPKRKYQCSGYSMRGRSVCGNFSVSEELLVDIVCESLQERLLSPENLDRLKKELRKASRESRGPETTSMLQKQIEGLERKLKAAKKRLVEVDPDMIGVVQDHIRELQDQASALKAQLKLAETPEKRLIADHESRVKTALASVDRLRDVVRGGDRRLAREFLSEAVECVEVRFHSEKHGSRWFSHLEGGAIRLKGSEFTELFSTASRAWPPR